MYKMASVYRPAPTFPGGKRGRQGDRIAVKELRACFVSFQRRDAYLGSQSRPGDIRPARDDQIAPSEMLDQRKEMLTRFRAQLANRRIVNANFNSVRAPLLMQSDE